MLSLRQKISMKKFKVSTHFSEKALKKILSSQTEARALRGWNVIYFAYKNPDLKADKIADNLGVSRSYVFNVIKGYNKRGKNWYVPDRRGGRKEKRCHTCTAYEVHGMSLEEEKLVMKSLEEDALLGSILTFRHIKKKIEERVGKEVSEDYIWDLFSRHGWKKKVPRGHHPKVNKAAQDEYKKNSKKIWLPSH